MVDSGLLVGSLANSQSGFGAKPDSEPGSVTGSGLVADYESATRIDSATAKHS